MLDFKVKKLNNFFGFSKGNPDDAGYDLYACNYDKIMVQAGQRALISCGISVSCNPDWYLRVAPRSGLAVRRGVDVLAGVVDSSYRGEVKVVVQNHGKGMLYINRGMRIAQLIPTQTSQNSYEFVDELPDSLRGEDGFGSTGS